MPILGLLLLLLAGQLPAAAVAQGGAGVAAAAGVVGTYSGDDAAFPSVAVGRALAQTTQGAWGDGVGWCMMQGGEQGHGPRNVKAAAPLLTPWHGYGMVDNMGSSRADPPCITVEP